MRNHNGLPARRMRALQMTCLAAATLLCGSPLVAQRQHAASLTVPPAASRDTARDLGKASAAVWRRERTRGSSMVAGGLIGGWIGAGFSGVQIARGTPEARNRIFVYPLAGVALGVLIGAAVFREPRAR